MKVGLEESAATIKTVLRQARERGEGSREGLGRARRGRARHARRHAAPAAGGDRRAPGADPRLHRRVQGRRGAAQVGDHARDAARRERVQGQEELQGRARGDARSAGVPRALQRAELQAEDRLAHVAARDELLHEAARAHAQAARRRLRRSLGLGRRQRQRARGRASRCRERAGAARGSRETGSGPPRAARSGRRAGARDIRHESRAEQCATCERTCVALALGLPRMFAKMRPSEG